MNDYLKHVKEKALVMLTKGKKHAYDTCKHRNPAETRICTLPQYVGEICVEKMMENQRCKYYGHGGHNGNGHQ